MKSEIEGFVDSGGVKIHYIAKGAENAKKLSLLFVPGVMMPAFIWEKQMDYFSKYYHVVAIEPRSQGYSDQASDGHEAVTMAKDIQAVVQALNLASLVVVGWSIGVPQVLNYAMLVSLKGILGLVLVDGIAGLDGSVPFYKSMVHVWGQFQMDRIKYTKNFIRSIFKKTQSESYYKKITDIAMRTPTNTVMTLIYNYMWQDFRSILPRLDVKTFIATIDGPRLGYMQKMQQMLPDCSLEIFASAGHALFVDEPELFNHSLEEFISTLAVE